MKSISFKLLMTGLLAFGSISAFADPGSITAIGSFGSARDFGRERVVQLTKAIKYECQINRGAELLSKVECIKFEDYTTSYRLCSAVCSKGNNMFITTKGYEFIKVTK